MTDLDLGSNQLNSTSAILINAMLKVNKKIAWLGLDNNPLGDNGIQNLLSGIPLDTGLRELHLNNDGITDTGAQYLSSLLARNISSLKVLAIGYNQISQAGIEILSDSLPLNNFLTAQRKSRGLACPRDG